MLFVLKKAFSRLLFPLPLTLLIMIVGLVLCRHPQRRRIGMALTTGALLLLFLFSSEVIGVALLKPLEDRYPSFGPAQAAQVTPEEVRYIVVFAGCVRAFEEYPITRQVGGAPLERLVEGIRLYHLYPDSMLVLSGGLNCDQDAPVEALTNYRFAAEMGVPPERIIIERASLDTEDQVRLLSEMLFSKMAAGERLILVTSAAHMPRSMLLFRRQGLEPIPAPTDHRTGLYGIFRRQSIGAESFYPNAGSLQKTENAIYEYLGLLWARLSGKL